MRYHCESYSESVNHVTPSILMLDNELQREHNHIISTPPTIIDIGCGNGCNSLYLARKYKSDNVVLVDCDVGMLEWARQLFGLHGIPAKSVHTTAEELASHPFRLNDKMGISKFDFVIFSYVIQHIDPVYYPLVLDFCRQICSKYVALGIFWNPSRLRAGEFIEIDRVNWYGLTYEEIVTLLAPRFRILNDKVLKTSIAVMMNILLSEGQTPLGSVLKRSYEFYSDRVKHVHVHSGGTNRRDANRIINIDELQCTKLLGSLYPGEFDVVRTEMTQWIQNSYRITPSLAAARFLWYCRINKIPATFNEVCKDFGISTKRVMQNMSETDYIPALGASEYVDRLPKQLSLADFVRDAAIDLVDDCVGGTSPTVKACCAVLKAAKLQGIRLTKGRVASILDVTPVGIHMALKREGSHNQ